MSARMVFEQWRGKHKAKQGWGLAWFLANEFCARYYASHGVVPHVIDFGGHGYYGIQFDMLPCPVHGASGGALGRLTMNGDVENYRTDAPGAHGLDTAHRCDEGASTRDLVRQAVEHMDLPPYPHATHVMCRHKRWGASYVLCFEVASILGMHGGIGVWNHPTQLQLRIEAFDPAATMPEHPGAFLFEHNGHGLIVTGDGRLLDGSGENLWQRYMAGDDALTLAAFLMEKLR